MYPTLYHVSGEAGMDGCVEMMLDDVSYLTDYYLITRKLNQQRQQ